jgi:hypothetical protein
MSDGIVFVLHVAADEKLAAGLAAALAPAPAFPALLPKAGAGSVEYGMGAVCVVVWSEAALDARADVLNAVSHGAPNAVICRVASAPVPDEFENTACVVVDIGGDPPSDAPHVREAIARIGRERADRSARPGRRRASLGSSAALYAEGPPPSKSRKLPVRSAVGLAATLAIVGVVAPTIGPRGATSAEPDHRDVADDQAELETASAEQAADDADLSANGASAETATVEYAALDAAGSSALAQYLLRSEPSLTDASAVSAAAPAPVRQDELTPEPAAAIDPPGAAVEALTGGPAVEAPVVAAEVSALDGAALEDLSAAKGAPLPPASTDDDALRSAKAKGAPF